MTDFPLAARAGRDASRLRIRSIHAQDEAALAALFDGLDPLSRRQRFHGPVKALSPAWLQELARADDPGRIVLVATTPHAGREALVAEARCVTDASGSAAEFAISVAPAWRRQGIASHCLRSLRDAAADQGLRWLYGHVLADNLPMLALLRGGGFAITRHRGDGTLMVAETRCRDDPPSAPRPDAPPRFALFHPFRH